METSIRFELDSYMKEVLEMGEVDIRSYSPLTLAFIGDCIFDLVIKTMIVRKGNQPVNQMQKETSRYVQAAAQSYMMRFMQEHLTEEERAVYRRGRNAKSVSPAKNQSITDYRRATGFEALLGYLYLKKEYRRMIDLIKIGLDGLNEKEEE
ncbi:MULTISPECIES: Mini-ribonuclease 3 [Sellimonas]|uniref:Mini-ribonuclease 3 n=1 Tax=Sellimonas caecigallum TaxID=2592333 RepID=A0ABS7L6D9_9FIRM|nr:MULTISPECIES: ribonuclease III domain-containing protein [Sellimonas]MBY0758639.1 ribonuclease III [Sellimonas caecigallum]OUP03264.1 ribonuclease III [Drancourtella sp. An210]OUP66369.1 ribonuclease III [Drancourtella sp. An177]